MTLRLGALDLPASRRLDRLPWESDPAERRPIGFVPSVGQSRVDVDESQSWQRRAIGFAAWDPTAEWIHLDDETFAEQAARLRPILESFANEDDDFPEDDMRPPLPFPDDNL